MHEKALDDFKRAEDNRTPVVPPKYPPDLPPVLEPPKHPANEKRYKELLAQGHAGDRVFFTDGTMWNSPLVIGSKDGVLKGDGLMKEVVEMLNFEEKIVTFKPAYDGGMTLIKHDCYPKEDPDEWIHKDEEKWIGEFRKGQEGEGSEEW